MAIVAAVLAVIALGVAGAIVGGLAVDDIALFHAAGFWSVLLIVGSPVLIGLWVWWDNR